MTQKNLQNSVAIRKIKREDSVKLVGFEQNNTSGVSCKGIGGVRYVEKRKSLKMK